MSPVVFVTGTDTGVGKTLVTVALMQALRVRGLRVAGMKPVASGCRRTPAGLRNEDALAIQAAASSPAAYEEVNPCAFEPAIAPHLAAAEAGVALDPASLAASAARLAAGADRLLVEGAGGWLVPLGAGHTLADLAVRLRARVVLVVGLRLGCLNHALLTAEAVRARGLELAGWVGNAVDQTFERRAENLATLEEMLPVPCLGVVPHLSAPDPAAVAPLLDVTTL